MSYDIFCTTATLKIHESEGLNALREFFKNPNHDRSLDYYTEHLDKAESLADFFTAINIKPILIENQIGSISYEGPSTNQDQLFEILAPFIEDGSYIEWVGEGCEKWRWSFKGGKMVEQYPLELWPKPGEPYIDEPDLMPDINGILQ